MLFARKDGGSIGELKSSEFARGLRREFGVNYPVYSRKGRVDINVKGYEVPEKEVVSFLEREYGLGPVVEEEKV